MTSFPDSMRIESARMAADHVASTPEQASVLFDRIQDVFLEQSGRLSLGWPKETPLVSKDVF
jgi:hypothetical protein